MSSSITKFDVFLSFVADDITKTFVKNLCRSLSENGVTTSCKDEKVEESVSSLGSDVNKSIIESKLAVVVVSRSYPTSVLCLNQLETIITSRSQSRFSVLPIFYEVDPSNVRKQAKESEEQFKKLGEEYPDEKIQTWRNALIKLTNIPSLQSSYWNIEAKAIEFITKEVMVLIADKPKATKADGLVAMDRHMQALYKLFDLKSQDEVRLLGICGPGGVGKTTLARYAYEKISTNFHAHMFVEKAEKMYHQDPYRSKKIQNGAQTDEKSFYDGIKSRVGHRKSLLVTDCVENVKQVKDIVAITSWCGPGSRVILVTEEKSLLVEFGVKHVYEVKSLRYHEALQLFSQFAFNQKFPLKSFESLSSRAVQVAEFLPLTIKILGSSLHGKNFGNWEKELQKLEGDQEKAIAKALNVNGDLVPREELKQRIPSTIYTRYLMNRRMFSQAASWLSSKSSSQASSKLYSQTSSQLSSQLSSQTSSRLYSQTSSQLSSQAGSGLSSSWSYNTPSSRMYSQTSNRLSSQPNVGQLFPTNYSPASNRLFSQPNVGQLSTTNYQYLRSYQLHSQASSRSSQPKIDHLFPTNYQYLPSYWYPTNRHPPTDEHRTADTMDTPPDTS